MSEVVYHFLKDIGWVPETDLSLKLRPRTGWDYLGTYAHDAAAREWIASTERLWRDIRSTRLARQVSPQFQRSTFYLSNDYYAYTDSSGNTTRVNRNTPEPSRAPVRPEPSAYFPGSGVAPERRTQSQNQHARRLQEFRDALARFRRR